MLEDSTEDVHLIKRELKLGGISFDSFVVDTRVDFEQSLYQMNPDVILADYSLPQFNSIEALKIHRQYQLESKVVVPFILVTGSISEEFAVKCIKAGADDYILKDRLKRLPDSIRNALEKTNIENDRIRFLDKIISDEAMMREAEQLAHFGSWQVDLVTGAHKWSDENYRIFGYEPGGLQLTYEAYLGHIHPEDRQSIRDAIHETILHRDSHPCEFRIIDKSGKIKHILSNILVKRNQEHLAVQLSGFNLDITQQRKQNEALTLQNKQLIEIGWIQSHEIRAPLARIMGLLNLMKSISNDEKTSNEFWKPLLESAHDLDAIIRKIVRKTESADEKGN